MSYSIKEIIDIAVEIEEAGYTFYTKCSKKFDDPELSNLFSFLAEQELQHKKTFQGMSTSGESPGGHFTEEYYLYLQSIGGDRVFSKKIDLDTFIDSLENPMDAIEKAFHDEKESILFYSEVKTLYDPQSKATSLLNKIIEEERKHVLKLMELKEKIA